MAGDITTTVGWLLSPLFDKRYTRTGIGRDSRQYERLRALAALEL